jgi:hypothetical protein
LRPSVSILIPTVEFEEEFEEEEEDEEDLETTPSPSLFTSKLTKMQGSLWLRVSARCRKTL